MKNILSEHNFSSLSEQSTISGSYKKDMKLKQKELINKQKKIFANFLINLKIKENAGKLYEYNDDYINNFYKKMFIYPSKYKKPTVISENQYYEKIILSKIIEELDTSTFFYKNKDKIFNNSKIKEIIKKKEEKKKEEKKGGAILLKPDGDSLLQILHIFDAKHDFDKFPDIKDYINKMFDRYISTSTFSQTIKDEFIKLYQQNDNNYEEFILNYIISKNNLLVDSIDQNTNIMYVDINDTNDKFLFFKREDKTTINTIDVDNDELANTIKDFYDFNTFTKDKYQYLYDTSVKTHNSLDAQIRHLKSDILDNFSTHITPFENAYDPHSSTKINIFSDNEFDEYNRITDYNFNQSIEEHYSAIRNLTRYYLNFTTTKSVDYTDLYLPTIKLINFDINKIIYNLQKYIITSGINTTIISKTFNLQTIKDHLEHGEQFNIGNNILFFKDISGLYNINYITSFNTIELLKEFIQVFIGLKNKDYKTLYNTLYNYQAATRFSANNNIYLLYFIVTHLIFSSFDGDTQPPNINNLIDNIINILFDLKKSGDWGQSLFCSRSNELYGSRNEVYFVSGDKLSAGRGILNGNVKTITATNYYGLIDDEDVSDGTTSTMIGKKCILTLFNGKNKAKFYDLNLIINKSIFQFYAFKDLFNHDNIIQKFKINPITDNNITIDDTNLNFKYFWYFITIIIYQMRIYNNCYSVFRLKNINEYEDIKITIERLKLNDIYSTIKDEYLFRKFDIDNNFIAIKLFNENIFNFDNNNDEYLEYLKKWLKYIDTKLVDNIILDSQYIQDIIKIATNIFEINISIYPYKTDSTIHFIDYLNEYYNQIVLANKINAGNLIKFLKNICNLNTLCQILYIDRITKEETYNIDDIKTMLINPEYQQKTILKEIVEKFYNDICILIHNFQYSTGNIGNDTYMTTLNIIMKTVQIYSKEIKIINDTITPAINELEKHINILNGVITEYNNANPSNNIKLLTSMEDNLNIIISISKYDTVKNGLDNLTTSASESTNKNNKSVFKKFGNIYKETIENFSQYTLTNVGVDDRIKQLYEDYKLFIAPNYDEFMILINKFIKTIDNMRFKNKIKNNISNFSTYLNGQKQQIKNKANYIDILDTINNNIINIYPNEIKTFVAQITALGVINTDAKIIEINDKSNKIIEKIDAIVIDLNKIQSDICEKLRLTDMTAVNTYSKNINGINKIISNIINKLNYSLSRKISPDLHEYFNTEILLQHNLIPYKDFNKVLIDNIKNSFSELIKIPELTSFLNDKTTDLIGLKVNIKHRYEILIKILNILKANIQEIYNIDNIRDEHTGNFFKMLKIENYNSTNKILFKKSIDELYSLRKQIANTANIKRKRRETQGIPASRYIETQLDKRGKKTDKTIIDNPKLLKLRYWYSDSVTYNQVFKIINDNKIDDAKTILNKDSLRALYDKLFKKSTQGSFFKLPNYTQADNINMFFENIGFIENIWLILQESINKYNSIIYEITNIINVNNYLSIHDFLKHDVNYYNEDKNKIITIIGAYIKYMLDNKLKYLSENRSDGIFKFDKLYKRINNPEKKISIMSNMLDAIMNFTKSKYISYDINKLQSDSSSKSDESDAIKQARQARRIARGIDPYIYKKLETVSAYYKTMYDKKIMEYLNSSDNDLVLTQTMIAHSDERIVPANLPTGQSQRNASSRKRINSDDEKKQKTKKILLNPSSPMATSPKVEPTGSPMLTSPKVEPTAAPFIGAPITKKPPLRTRRTPERFRE